MKYSSRNQPREISKLPLVVVQKIFVELNILSEDPRPNNVKKLIGLKDYCRIRIGDYRIIYSINDDQLIVLILKAGHRKNIYQ
ncbi:type II toxin-antitoxin system RelE family toxin [Mucilaginibacter sp.]